MEVVINGSHVWAIYREGIKIEDPSAYISAKFEYVEGEFVMTRYLVSGNLVLVEPVTLVIARQDHPRLCCDGEYGRVPKTYDQYYENQTYIPAEEDDPDFDFYRQEATEELHRILKLYPELKQIPIKLAIEGEPYIPLSLSEFTIEEILFKGTSEHSHSVFDLDVTKVSLFRGYIDLLSDAHISKFTDVSWNSCKPLPLQFNHLNSYSTPSVEYRPSDVSKIEIPKTKIFTCHNLWSEHIHLFFEYGVEEIHLGHLVGGIETVKPLPPGSKVYEDGKLIIGKEQTLLTELL